MEREQESLLIPVWVGAESQLNEAWTPATISQGGGLLLLANRKRVLSVRMWAYSCSTVWAFPWKVSVGVRVFRLQISAAYFQLPIFSSVTLVVYVEDRREERESAQRTVTLVFQYLLSGWTSSSREQICKTICNYSNWKKNCRLIG